VDLHNGSDGTLPSGINVERDDCVVVLQGWPRLKLPRSWIEHLQQRHVFDLFDLTAKNDRRTLESIPLRDLDAFAGAEPIARYRNDAE